MIEEGTKQIPLCYWNSHSNRQWCGKINTEYLRGTYVTVKNNTGKKNREWVMGAGDASLYPGPLGDSILGEEVNLGVLDALRKLT